MARAKRGFKARRRRNKILKMAQGFHFDRRRKYRRAAETVTRALQYAFKGRKFLKRDMKELWIVRINAAARILGKSYSRFMSDLKTKNISLNRKMLAEIAVKDAEGFKAIYEAAK